MTVEVFDRTPPDLAPSTQEAIGPTNRGVRAVDRVLLDGGHGSLVQTLPVPGATAAGTTVYLITDEGVKYPLTTTTVDAKTALGYGDVAPVLVPASLLRASSPPAPRSSTAAALSFTGGESTP